VALDASSPSEASKLGSPGAAGGTRSALEYV
jgi:hypothetical protein